MNTRRALPTVTAEQMREVDRILVEEVGLQLVQMMQDAAANVVGPCVLVRRWSPAGRPGVRSGTMPGRPPRDRNAVTATASRTTAPPTALRATQGLAGLVALGVLLQSAFAGGFLRSFYADGGALGSSLTWHELGANATFGLLAVEGLVVLATPLRRRTGQLVSGVLLAVLLTGVIGLGYVGGGAVALHVPLGVLAFGAALVHLAYALGVGLRPGGAADA